MQFFKNTDGIPLGPKHVDTFSLRAAAIIASLLTVTSGIASPDGCVLLDADDICLSDSNSLEKILENFEANMSHMACGSEATVPFHFIEEGRSHSLRCCLT